MTRIIAGLAGGVTLHVPGVGTRPTSERVREALFGALDARGLCDGAHVLDLFAGSGALGLEAASRGAETVVLVERNRAAARVAIRNADAVAASGGVRAEVVQQPARQYLQSTSRTFDLVLVDPPYDIDETELAGVLADLAPHLAHPAVLVVERSRRAPEPEVPGDVEAGRVRTYGDTVLHWFETVSSTG